MTDGREETRLAQMESCIPDIFEARTMLYVGAYEKRFHFSEKLKASNIAVDILEIGPENCTYLSSLQWINKIINGDIRDIDNLKNKLSIPYDVLLWSHGPNMIYPEDLRILLPKLDNIAKTIVLLSTWGRGYNFLGNTPELKDYMTTKVGNVEDDFKGYTIDTIGRIDELGNNILAWRRTNG